MIRNFAPSLHHLSRQIAIRAHASDRQMIGGAKLLIWLMMLVYIQHVAANSQPAQAAGAPAAAAAVAASSPFLLKFNASEAYLELPEPPELEVAQLVVTKFRDLFEGIRQDHHENSTINNSFNSSSGGGSTTTDASLQATLETRKMEAASAAAATASAAGPVPAAVPAATRTNNHELNDRNYFKILNRVFSRVALPELYKSSRNPPSRGLHCGPHIGCIEEIPNFPSLLKRPNISSSFTIYTPTGPKSGKKILFEPIIHHQLQDDAITESKQQLLHKSSPVIDGAANSLEADGSNSNNNNSSACGYCGRRQQQPPSQQPPQSPPQPQLTAASWRSASKIVQSQEFPFDLASLEQSGFDSSLNTRIIVGGYFAKEDEEWIDEIVRQWTLLEPASNIIKLSWADANRGLYHTAAYNSRIVGRQLTLFLHYLDQLFHIDLGRFHLVGHSLGAHIAGFAGADNEGRIARITGLDPAGPIFVELNASMRLDPGDAQFVDVLHTNGGTITKGALGLSTPSGHVDYYCNGGSIQPGCYFSSVTKSMMDPVERVACSHRRSYRYFTELIRLAISENALVASSSSSSSYSSYYPPMDFLDLSSSSGQNSSSSGGGGGGGGGEIPSIHDNFLARRRLDDQLEQPAAAAAAAGRMSQSSKFPLAFLFEAKQEDLVRLSQPEILLLSGNSMARRVGGGGGGASEAADSLAPPLKRQLEFHEMRPNFPVGKRGTYFFRTRSESPFFASKQYALTLRTDTVVKRKITLMVRIEHTLVAEVETDEIPGHYTLAFAPNDPKILNLSEKSVKIPQVSLMWRFRSFNLLLNQQNELPLIGLELSLLDHYSTDGDQAPLLVKYHLQAGGGAGFAGVGGGSNGIGGGGAGVGSSSLPSAVLRGISGSNFIGASLGGIVGVSSHMALARNQWHKFEGKLVTRPAAAAAA